MPAELKPTTSAASIAASLRVSAMTCPSATTQISTKAGLIHARCQIRALRLDYRARLKEAPHHSAARPSGGFAVARALNLRIGF